MSRAIFRLSTLACEHKTEFHLKKYCSNLVLQKLGLAGVKLFRNGLSFCGLIIYYLK